MADEYIRREDFIQHLEKCKKGAAVTNLVWAAIMAIERDVRDMPAADVAPVVHGKWLRVDDDWNSLTTIQCPICSEEWCFETDDDVSLLNYKYCPNCGAKMDGGNEGE